ncbi:MAG TPA: hypothetical protein VKV06_02270 [Acidimicrobiales bacterium]|nr:hypothetical protein [Acidimicrobiales bacterium]
MNVVLWIVAGGLAVLLLAFTAVAIIVGLLAVFTGERWERCPECGTPGLTIDGLRHPDGCPHRLPVHVHLHHSMHLHHGLPAGH